MEEEQVEEHYILQYTQTGDRNEYFLVNKQRARLGDNFPSKEEVIGRAFSLGVMQVSFEIPDGLLRRIKKSYVAGGLISKVEE